MTRHHIFTYLEVKQKLIETYDILGKDKTGIDQRAAYLWRSGPTIMLARSDHDKYHQHFDGIKPEKTRKIEAYWDEKHGEIAEEIGTHPRYVQLIRGAILGYGETWNGYARRMMEKAKRPRRGYDQRKSRSEVRRHKSEFYIGLSNFMKGATETQREIILQKIEKG